VSGFCRYIQPKGKENFAPPILSLLPVIYVKYYCNRLKREPYSRSLVNLVRYCRNRLAQEADSAYAVSYYSGTQNKYYVSQSPTELGRVLELNCGCVFVADSGLFLTLGPTQATTTTIFFDGPITALGGNR
jgi:hypothetical protein